MSISEAEKIKSPILAFIAGGIFFAGVTWGAISSIYDGQFRMYELSKAELLKKNYELEKKYADQKKELQTKESEVLSLSKELEVSSGRVAKDKTARLQTLIKQIDSEIAYKNKVLAMQSGISTDTPKSDFYIRTEKEIDALLERRNQAQKHLIEVNTQ
jgi:hypothetical protein